MNLVSIGTNITQKAESGKFIHPAPHVILPAACCRAASDPPAKQEAPQQSRRGGRRHGGGTAGARREHGGGTAKARRSVQQKDRSDGPADKATRRHPPSPVRSGSVRSGSVQFRTIPSGPGTKKGVSTPLWRRDASNLLQIGTMPRNKSRPETPFRN